MYIYLTRLPSLQPQLFHPQARLLWKRCADVPVEMFRAQAVVMGEKVYMGGGNPEGEDDYDIIYQYSTSKDEWNRLPPRLVAFFAMAQFVGNLITVGGLSESAEKDYITGKVYRFKEESQEWEEFLKPMPTARCACTVATTQSTIIATGGATGVRDDGNVPCIAVEVYCSETSQWYTADPLPAPCYLMSSVTITNTCYLLGGVDADANPVATVLYAHLTSLIQKATSPTHQSASHTSVWKTLPDTPLMRSTAASLCGNLLAIGGSDGETISPEVYVFFPLNNTWVRIMTGALLEPRAGCTAVQLSSNTMMVIGGGDFVSYRTDSVFIGTVTV